MLIFYLKPSIYKLEIFQLSPIGHAVVASTRKFDEPDKDLTIAGYLLRKDIEDLLYEVQRSQVFGVPFRGGDLDPDNSYRIANGLRELLHFIDATYYKVKI